MTMRRQATFNRRRRATLTPNGSALERRFELVWAAVGGPELVREHRFHPTRKWQLDFAHLATKTAIELEGGVWTKGRHTRGRGFIEDCQKYNAAVGQGWTVFRLATGMVRVPAVEAIKQHVAKAESGKRKAENILGLPLPAVETLNLNGWRIVRAAHETYPADNVWVIRIGGEAMETTTEKLAAAVAKFFAKEF